MSEHEQLEKILNAVINYYDRETEDPIPPITIDEAITKLETMLRETRVDEVHRVMNAPLRGLTSLAEYISTRLRTLTTSKEQK